MHYHWAKLYLQSYVLRGLPDSNPVIPSSFLENASAAVQAAITIINLLLEDKDAQIAIGYVPHHIHGMVAFAAMFLLKVATRHSEQLFVDKIRFQRLIGGLAEHLATIDVGKDHLTHRMAEGLSKMSESLGGPTRPRSKSKNGIKQGQDQLQQTLPTFNPTQTPNGANGLPDYGGVDTTAFDFGDPTLGLGMPFFDFEGTTLDGDGNLWSFN